MSNQIKKEFQQKNEPVRLNKYLSEAGVCSRRNADKLIESGAVTIDGKKATMGMKVLPGQVVKVGKKTVSRTDEMVVLAVNKPVGIVCTEERRERNSIVRFLNYPIRVTYIGRLDKDSHGLLLMTNNGDIINKMMRAGNQHEKEPGCEALYLSAAGVHHCNLRFGRRAGRHERGLGRHQRR